MEAYSACGLDREMLEIAGDRESFELHVGEFGCIEVWDIETDDEDQKQRQNGSGARAIKQLCYCRFLLGCSHH